MHIETLHKIWVHLAVILISIYIKIAEKSNPLKHLMCRSLTDYQLASLFGGWHMCFLGGHRDTAEQSSALIQTEGLEGFSYIDCCFNLPCLNKRGM